MRGGSSKTRIETHQPLSRALLKPVWEEVPVKQGLKLNSSKPLPYSFPGMRGGSSKTRIETLLLISTPQQRHCMRGGSSKTRIETWSLSRAQQFFPLVWEEVPVKQGLKPNFVPSALPNNSRMRGGSSKTRIETRNWFPRWDGKLKYERRFQ